MRKVGLLLGMVLLLGLTAAAQDSSKVDLFAGYSYVRATPATPGAPGFNLNGGSASAAYYLTRSFGIVSDFGGYHVSRVGSTPVSGTLYTYLFGPRLAYHGSSRVTPFAQALFGGAHGSASAFGGSASGNAFAMSAGGGLDVNASEHIGFRLVQAEYLMSRFREGPSSNRSTQNNARISTGIVFRW